MFRPAAIVLLTILASACSLMPPKSEHVRARQMEAAVIPMATTALETGQLETARRLYRRLLDIDAESVPARMGLGDVALKERDTVAAARWYLSALTRAAGPEDRHAALLAHGRAALAAGQLEAAKESFTRLTEPGENAPRASVAWGYNGIGLALLLEGVLPEAVVAMEQAVLRAPEEARFQANLNRALAMLGQYPPPEDSSGGRMGLGSDSAGKRDDVGSQRSTILPPEPAVVETSMPERTESEDVQSTVPTPDPRETKEAAQFERSDDPSKPRSEDPQQSNRAPDRSLTVELPAREQPVPTEVQSSSVPDASAPEGRAEPGLPAPEEASSPVRSEEFPTADSSVDLAASAQVAETVAPSSAVGESDGSAGEAIQEEDPPNAVAEETGPTAPDTDGAPTPGLSSPPLRIFVVTESNLPFLQFGAYAKPENAGTVAAHLRGLTEHTVTISETEDEAGVSLHRVRMGPIPTWDALVELIAELEAQGYRIANPARASMDDGIRTGLAHRSIQTLLVLDAGERYLQAGAYSERSAAELLATELRGLTDQPVWISEVARSKGTPLHRVRVGPLEPDDPLIELLGPKN